MSERSYLRNRSLGVAGPNTNACFPQAFDRITPEAAVSYDTYHQYGYVMAHWDEKKYTRNIGIGNQWNAWLYDKIAQDLGGYTLLDMQFEYAYRAQRIERVLDNFFANEFRPVLDLVARSGSIHSVGVKQLDEGLYRLVGYGVPAHIRNRPVTARELESSVHDPGFDKTATWQFQGRNISALPKPATQRAS